MNTQFSWLSSLGLAVTILAGEFVSHAQTNAFTYQGFLTTSGKPVNGNHEFTVRLCSAATDGPILEARRSESVLVTNGTFTLQLNFSPSHFTGAARWLELAVRTNGGGAFTTLAPRQQLHATPYSIYSHNAGLARSIIPGGVGAEQLAPGSIGTPHIASLDASVVNSGILDTNILPAALGPLSLNNGAGLTNLLRRFNVRDFGAAGDGVTPDEMAIQAAIDAAAAAGGGVVWLPRGTYAIGTEYGNAHVTDPSGLYSHLGIFSNNIHLIGEGVDVTTIRRTTPGLRGNLINSKYATNITIANLTVDAGWNKVYNVLAFLHTDRVRIADTRWQNHHDDAVEFADSGTVLVSDSTFFNIAANAVALNAVSEGLVSDVVIEECGFKDPANYNAPAHIQGNWAAIQLRNGHFRLNNVIAHRCQTAIQYIGRRLFASNCHFGGTVNTQTNVYLIAGDARIQNSRFSNVPSHARAIHAAGTTYRSGAPVGGGSPLGMVNCEVQVEGTGLVASNRVSLLGCTFSSLTPNDNILLKGGVNHGIHHNNFVNNGGTGIRVATGGIRRSLISGNTFVSAGIRFDPAAAAGSEWNVVADNLFDRCDLILRGASNLISGNVFVGSASLWVVSGAEFHRVEHNVLNHVKLTSAPDWLWCDNTIAGTISLTGGREQINRSTWIANRGPGGAPLRSGNVTSDYTLDALDELILFDGPNLTATLPDANIVKRGKTFILKNIHVTSLTLTNSTGTQKIDAALSRTLPQHRSLSVISDGAQWRVINDSGGMP